MSHERESDLGDLERLRATYREFSAPEPDEAAWQRTSDRLHRALDGTGSKPVRAARAWWALTGLSAAVALLGLALLPALWKTSPPEIETPRAAVEPFPVAEDVVILSMDARDAAALVVGELPVSGDMEFAQPTDIRVIRCERCPYSGRMARLEKGDEVPMFVSAAVVPPDDE